MSPRRQHFVGVTPTRAVTSAGLKLPTTVK